MPAGLRARQLPGVCQSLGSTKDYLGSFMCCHNWQYLPHMHYSVRLLFILQFSQRFAYVRENMKKCSYA